MAPRFRRLDPLKVLTWAVNDGIPNAAPSSSPPIPASSAIGVTNANVENPQDGTPVEADSDTGEGSPNPSPVEGLPNPSPVEDSPNPFPEGGSQGSPNLPPAEGFASASGSDIQKRTTDYENGSVSDVSERSDLLELQTASSDVELLVDENLFIVSAFFTARQN